MGINNVDDRTLSFVFSIAKEPKSGEWGVQVVEDYLHNYKKGVDLKVGPLSHSWNKSEFSAGQATMVLKETELKKKITRLRGSAAIDVAPYEKALEALQAFKKVPSDEGYEILRQTNTFDVEGNRLTGRKAVLHTVEKDASGAETSFAKAFKAQDMARYVFQLRNDDFILHMGFYHNALEKIGGKRKYYGTDIKELLKPFKFEVRP